MVARAALSRGFACHRLSQHITLYVNELAPQVSPGRPIQEATLGHKPLTLMLPWKGARPQAVAKYCEIYLRTGFDVLVVESEVKDFLWPQWGLARGKSILDLLHSDLFVSRPLFVHAFSIGGYTFGQMLVHVLQDTQKYEQLTRRIKGQVFDSIVIGSLEKMATGLGKTVFPRLESLIKHTSLLYFSLFEQQTVAYFNRSIEACRNTPVKAPALFFYCDNDAMSDSEAVEELMALWRKHGITVAGKRWEKSQHAGHLKTHPQEYLTTLDIFLHSLNMSPLKAKM
ncbi:transmembrane protein 53 [Synchiropus splendidus]|uniref:transmembrane protein 53 n=1 Tax=Synchiropus splendidus TaxID=270530 RepID=UPI00237D721C|nr:transmembrane protein 53 [Synchiropus splendidus]